MKQLAFALLLLAVVTMKPVAQPQNQRAAAGNSSAPIRTMLDTYCISCHSATAKAGGVAFAGMSLEDVGGNAEIWEKAARKLRGRLMPPPGSRQPSQTEVEAFISSLEDLLDKDARAPGRPVAGHVAIQRIA